MQFKPSPGLSVSLIAIALGCVWLGNWQLERKEEKQILFDRFENAPMLSIEQALKQDGRFSRVQAYGHFDDTRHILLDNKIFNGRAGVHVLTPFILKSGITILVNPCHLTGAICPWCPLNILRARSTAYSKNQRRTDPGSASRMNWSLMSGHSLSPTSTWRP
jgi:hypothetical protein